MQLEEILRTPQKIPTKPNPIGQKPEDILLSRPSYNVPPKTRAIAQRFLTNLLDSNDVDIEALWATFKPDQTNFRGISKLKCDGDLTGILKLLSSNTMLLQQLHRPEFTFEIELPTGSSSILPVSIQLEKLGHLEAALDFLFENIDELLRENRNKEIDALLRRQNVEKLSTDILLGLLTATAPARTRLSARSEFYSRVKQELSARNELDVSILDGLE